MPHVRSLDELSDAERGQLFPISLVDYRSEWSQQFEQERLRLESALGSSIARRIEHFGSTAVPGLRSKDIVDILIEIPPLTPELKQHICTIMKEHSYHFIWRSDDDIPYMMFVKGYTPSGFETEVLHVHMADAQHSLWQRLYFRDYLREHPTTAQDYQELKDSLAAIHTFDRDAYTRAKSEFIQRVTAQAVSESQLNNK